MNGYVHVLCYLIGAVIFSAQEAGTGAAFLNARDALPIYIVLEEMDHPQCTTHIQFDNKCANDILTNDALETWNARSYAL